MSGVSLLYAGVELNVNDLMLSWRMSCPVRPSCTILLGLYLGGQTHHCPAAFAIDEMPGG